MTPAPAPSSLAESSSHTGAMSGVLMSLYVLVCLGTGVLLFFAPWVPFWTKNFFVRHYPWVAAIARNYFLRGGISGIGLGDVWLAIHGAWRLRQGL